MTPQEKLQIKTRFFGKHIGCDVIHYLSQRKHTYHAVGNSLPNGDIGIYLENNGERAWFHSKNFKLVLRPLSSISDEEATKLAIMVTNYTNIICPARRDENKIEFIFWDSSNQTMKSLYFVIHFEPFALEFELFGNPMSIQSHIAADYLRSINVCLQFCDIDPVEAGWAILE